MIPMEPQLVLPQAALPVRQDNGGVPVFNHNQQISLFGGQNGGLPWVIPMGAAPKTMGEVIAACLGALPQVRMIQLGRSEVLHHVWTFTDTWTPQSRREIYAAQKRLLELVLGGFEMDFCVVHVPPGEDLADKCAGFPIIFQRR
ncbi:MAG: hypothetical protein ACRD2F_04715 [Terriglobales bacterium]